MARLIYRVNLTAQILHIDYPLSINIKEKRDGPARKKTGIFR